MTFEDAYALLPDILKKDMDLAALDDIIDKVAANSKWTNVEVAVAVFKLFHNICASPAGTPKL